MYKARPPWEDGRDTLLSWNHSKTKQELENVNINLSSYSIYRFADVSVEKVANQNVLNHECRPLESPFRVEKDGPIFP